jgi:hypothetical protein
MTTACGGAIVAAHAATDANANSSPTVDAYVGAGAHVTSDQDVDIFAVTQGVTQANATGLSGGAVVGAGTTFANAIVGQATITEMTLASLGDDSSVTTPTAETNAYAGAGSTINALGAITIYADDSESTDATATGGSLGLVAGATTNATAERNNPVAAEANDNATLTAGADVSIKAFNITIQTSPKTSVLYNWDLPKRQIIIGVYNYVPSTIRAEPSARANISSPSLTSVRS